MRAKMSVQVSRIMEPDLEPMKIHRSGESNRTPFAIDASHAFRTALQHLSLVSTSVQLCWLRLAPRSAIAMSLIALTLP